MSEDIKTRLRDLDSDQYAQYCGLLALERIEELEQALAEASKDAARFKWLIAQHWVEPEATFRLSLQETDDSGKYLLDASAAIDAAIIKENQHD